MRAVLADVVTLFGLALITVGVYGALRMPDIYTQLHAASKAAFLGVSAMLVAVAITGPLASVTRALLIIGLLALTTPVAAHAIAQAAYRRHEPGPPADGDAVTGHGPDGAVPLRRDA